MKIFFVIRLMLWEKNHESSGLKVSLNKDSNYGNFENKNSQRREGNNVEEDRDKDLWIFYVLRREV